MKNTKKEGKLRFLIYKANNKYTGVCFELGIVEEENDIEKLIYRLKNGSQAMVKAIIENNLDDTHLNKKVSLKYELIWYFGWILDFKNGFGLREKKPINNFNVGNVSPSYI